MSSRGRRGAALVVSRTRREQVAGIWENAGVPGRCHGNCRAAKNVPRGSMKFSSGKAQAVATGVVASPDSRSNWNMLFSLLSKPSTRMKPARRRSRAVRVARRARF